MQPSSAEPQTIGIETDDLEGLKPPGQNEPPPVPPETVYLTPEESEEYLSAIEIGSKTDSKLICGHRVIMKTADTDAELAIGSIIKPWIGTDAYNRAYKTAVCAACIIEVDGEPLSPIAVTDEDTEMVVRRRFERLKRYYPFFVDAMYGAVIEMEQQLKPLLEKLYTSGKESS